MYNGNGNLQYDTRSLDSATKTGSGSVKFAVINYPSNAIQNGNPDGIALVDAVNRTIQFISYEGTMTAGDGPAVGILSIDIGVNETSVTNGFSLQLSGTGCGYNAFTWVGAAQNTTGQTNTNQIINCP